MSDSASAAGISFTEHMSQVEIRPQRVMLISKKYTNTTHKMLGSDVFFPMHICIYIIKNVTARKRYDDTY